MNWHSGKWQKQWKGGQSKMTQTKKIVLTALFCGIALISSSFLSIPLGPIRAFPIQHTINVLLAVLLGTKYAVSGAFIVALLRNILGLGTIFAFPGSLVGALIAGIVYKKSNKLTLAAIGETFGTGIIGSLLCYPIAIFILGREATLFFVMPSFLASALIGAIISLALLKVLSTKEQLWEAIKANN